MTDLASKKCVPCQGGTPQLQGAALVEMMGKVQGWTCQRDKEIHKDYRFPDFAQALAFVNRVGALAEAEGHHPDIELSWGLARIKLWTHKVSGLTESDFILAAKIDTLPR